MALAVIRDREGRADRSVVHVKSAYTQVHIIQKRSSHIGACGGQKRLLRRGSAVCLDGERRCGLQGGVEVGVPAATRLEKASTGAVSLTCRADARSLDASRDDVIRPPSSYSTRLHG